MRYGGYGPLVMLGQISFCALGSFLLSCFVDLRLSTRFPVLKSPPSRLITFVSSYVILAHTFHFSRREGLRTISEEMLQKYRQESIADLKKTYEKGVSLEMSKDKKEISVKK